MKQLTTQDYIDGILAGDRLILSRAITLIESTRAEHQEQALQVLEACYPHRVDSQRIGITGVPGVGKSTFIEALGQHVIAQGHKLAVLAVDPSSQSSKGSILGDKTRMNTLAQHPNAYIRPSPNAGSLGGVTRKTREAILLCEAAGFDQIWIETVGVGQSETLVHEMVDFFLLLMLAGAGDELQGIKRGIMEMADGIVITKADGDNRARTAATQADLQGAVRFLPHGAEGPPWVLLCSALEKQGIDSVWDQLSMSLAQRNAGEGLQQRRQAQLLTWFEQTLEAGVLELFLEQPQLADVIKAARDQVSTAQVSPFRAASEVLTQLKKGFAS